MIVYDVRVNGFLGCRLLFYDSDSLTYQCPLRVFVLLHTRKLPVAYTLTLCLKNIQKYILKKTATTTTALFDDNLIFQTRR